MAPEEEQEIGFKRSELASTLFHSTQPLTIRMRINRANIGRVLIDTGAAKDILYYHTLVGMKMTEAHLTPYAGLLEGFTNHVVGVKGTMEFEVTIGEKPLQKTAKITFMVVDLPSQYNAILGVTAQAALGIVASVPHQRIKFNTPGGVATIKNQPERFLRTLEEKMKVENGQSSCPLKKGEDKQNKGKAKEIIPAPELIGIISFHSTKVELKMSRKAKQLAPVEGGYIDRGILGEIDREVIYSMAELPEARANPLSIVIDSLHNRKISDLRPNDELEEVVINSHYPEHAVKVGLEIYAEERRILIEFL